MLRPNKVACMLYDNGTGDLKHLQLLCMDIISSTARPIRVLALSHITARIEYYGRVARSLPIKI